MEAPLFAAAGIPAVVCGPSGGGLHAVDEWVDLRQVRAYPRALVTSFQGTPKRPRGMPTDPAGPARRRAAARRWLRFHEQAPTPFTIPGHKQRHDLDR